MTSSNEQTGHNITKRSPTQQFERLVLVVALIGLILTGLPQKFSLEGWADFAITMLGGIESTRILHRFFAVILTAEAVFHAVKLVYQWIVLKKRPGLFPGLRDWRALVNSTLANLGLRGQTETNSRFPLKIEYFVIVVSVVILMITGGILLNPILATDTLPSSSIPVAQIIHSDHALFLTLFIIIWRIGFFLWRPKPITDETASGRRGLLTAFFSIVFIALALVLIQFATNEDTAIDTVARQEVLVFSPQFVPEEGNPEVGEVVWATQRCAFCHGEDANGGLDSGPALPTENLTFDAFVVQIREGTNTMPAFTEIELPDSYLVHLWAWLHEKE